MTEPAGISRVPQMPGLDGMRALAVVAVMVYHADSTWLPGGFLGVEVFFVISGYLITLLLIGEHERTGRVSLGGFWARRARRLLPALFTMMLALVVYTALFRSEALGQLRGDVVAGTLYVSNWYQIWVGQGYTSAGDFAPMRHLWSLGVEEQFYLLWPLVMVGLLRLGRRRLPDVARWLLIVAVTISVVMGLLAYTGPIQACSITPDAYYHVAERCVSITDGLYLGTVTRLGGLMLGAAFAMVWRPVAIMRGPMRDRGRELDVVALFGLVGLGALVWSLHVVTAEGRADPWLFRGGFLVTGVATLAIMAAVTHRRTISARVLGTPLLVWIGVRSYGLYLFHWPIYQIIRRVAGTALTFAEFALAMVITVAVTEVSFRFIEMPIRRRRVRPWWQRLQAAADPGPRRLIAGVGAAVLAIVMVAGAALATAELQQNEIAQGLDEGRSATGDPFATTTVGSSPPSSAPAAIATTTPAGGPAPTAAATPTTSAPPTTRTDPDPCAATPIERYALGDSVMLGAAPTLKEEGFCVDAIESRAFINGIDRVRKLHEAERLGPVVVVNLGTNGPIGDGQLTAMMDELADVDRVVLVTIHADLRLRPDLAFVINSNDRMRRLAADYPKLRVVDWAEKANKCPGNCFYDDAIHLRPDGMAYYTKLITEALA